MPRNFQNIQFEVLRTKIDPIINVLHDDLEIAYYQNWKLGNPYDFFGFDVLGTPAESKTQFDMLHGLIFHLYNLLFAVTNANESTPNSNAKWNPDGDKLDTARAYIQNSGISIGKLNAIRKFVTDKVKADLNQTISIT